MNKGLTTVVATALLWATLVMTGCATTGVDEHRNRAAALNIQLGLAYLKQKKLDLAEIKLGRALKESPRSSTAQWANALLYEKLGNLDLAEMHYRRAVALAPKDSDAQNNFGAFLCRTGRVKEALSAFDAALKNPLYAKREFAITNAGICLRKHNDHAGAGAEDYFRRALKENPRYAPALYQMADMLYEQGRYLSSRAYRQRLEEALPRPEPKVLTLCIKTERAMGNNEVANRCEAQLKSRFPGVQTESK